MGTTPVLLGQVSEAPVVQNLGPGVLYLDTDPAVTTGTGLRVPVDAVYELPRDLAEPLYGVASAAGTDVRVMVVG